jgi:OOP family OmpA-OmpF porin
VRKSNNVTTVILIAFKEMNSSKHLVVRSCVSIVAITLVFSQALAQSTSQPRSPPQKYSVFFKNDSYALSPEANALLRLLIKVHKNQPMRTISVTGHADTLGPDGYNHELSRRRALVVYSALVSLGVPKAQIRTDWKGEKSLPFPTSDGVSFYLNRCTQLRL